MKNRMLAALLLGALTTTPAVHAAGKGEAAHDQAAKGNKTIYLVFYRDYDANAQAMAAAAKATAEKYAAAASWAPVAITDSSEKPLVDKYQLSRAPMPLTLVVHPSSVVTGVFQKPGSEADLAQCLIGRKKAECMKALQNNQLVLLCVQPTGQSVIPQGVRDFKADPHFAPRTQIVALSLDDASDAAFMSTLQVDPRSTTPVTVFMAPPGVMVGKFPATATKADFSNALHSAGKCCDDKNCKHNH